MPLDPNIPTADHLDILADLAKAKGYGDLTRRHTVKRNCPFCGGHLTMVQDAALATGLPLAYHTPAVGEVVKNHWMICFACGADQYS